MVGLRSRARSVLRRYVPSNLRLNRLARPVPRARLAQLPGVTIDELSLTSRQLREWLERFLPDARFPDPRFKKPVEFFATYCALQPLPQDIFLDAAGGVYTYLHRIDVAVKYMQDISISARLKETLGNGVRYLESDAGSILLADASVDKISCHHSFEHFEGDSDTAFIGEVQRLLRPGGRACILPLFVAERYLEVSSMPSPRKQFDNRSRRLVDLTATLPGGNHYARIYDPAALQRRVLEHIDTTRFQVRILELSMDGEPVPNLGLACNQRVAWINRPFRALIIDRPG